MTVLLYRAYAKYPAGATVELPAELETNLINQGLAATALATAVTTGAQTTSAFSGTAAIAAGQSSVVITNPNITANSKVWAVVNQAAADGTLLRVERIVPAAGLVTIYGTDAATATTFIDWALLQPPGLTPAIS